MQSSGRFAIAIHMLVATELAAPGQKVTSDVLAAAIGTNPVVVRGLMVQLKHAGLIAVKRGPGGMRVTKPLAEISFLDVWRAVEMEGREGLFPLHEGTDGVAGALGDELSALQADFERDLACRKVGDVAARVLRPAGERGR